MSPSRETLLQAAICLCTDFSAGSPVEVLMSHFTRSAPPTAIEHGHPDLAPFLGRPFVGRPAISAYFEKINALLAVHSMSFSDYIIDTDTLKVSCKGKARFVWKSTQQGWDEVFTWTLDFMEEGGEGVKEVKVRKYQVWADTGAAYLASRGELKQEEPSEEKKNDNEKS